MKTSLTKSFLISTSVICLLAHQAAAIINDDEEGPHSAQPVPHTTPQDTEEKQALDLLLKWLSFANEETSTRVEHVRSLFQQFPTLAPELLRRVTQITELCRGNTLNQKLVRIDKLVRTIQEEQNQ